jgi:NitT/TauT family transport system substrate-binding protein
MAISKNFNSRPRGLSRRRCLALLAALPGLAWLSGCSSFGTEPLRLAAHGRLGYAPLFLARDLGYLPKTTCS